MGSTFCWFDVLLDGAGNILADVFSGARGQPRCVDGKMPQDKVIANGPCNDAVAKWAFVLPNWKPTFPLKISKTSFAILELP